MSVSHRSKEPEVEILLATFNGANYLGEQLESIRNQTFSNWTLLVSDDCSTDHTLEVAEREAAIDSRIRVVSSQVKYGSAQSNFMNLLRGAKGPYVMFSDQDDVWLPSKIEESLKEMKRIEALAQEQPCLVFSDMVVVDEELRTVADSFERLSAIDPTRTQFQQVLAQSLGAGCSMMMNEPLLRYVHKTPDRAFMIMHDWWISIIAAAFGRIGHISHPLSMYRQHAGNAIGVSRYSAFDRMKNLERMRLRVELSIRQACSFQDVYLELLPKRKAAKLLHYTAIAQSNGLPGVRHLVLSQAWKNGARKVGQVIAVSSRRGKTFSSDSDGFSSHAKD